MLLIKNHSRQTLYLAALLILTMSGCATDQAAKVRSSRPITVGLWGGAIRPTSSAALVTDVAGLVTKDKVNFTPTDDKTDENTTSTVTQTTPTQPVTTTTSKADLGLHMYVGERSAFFWGLGVQYQRRQTQFASSTAATSLTNPVYADIVVDDKLTAVGPSVGWDWIWQNGISLFVDVGHRFVVSRQRSITNDGSGSNVNAQERDVTLAKADKYNSGLTLAPDLRMIIGYSF